MSLPPSHSFIFSPVTEKLTFEGTSYHNNGCFKCSICNETIISVSKAASLNGKIAHRLCLEQQMHTRMHTSERHYGDKVQNGALSAKTEETVETSTPVPNTSVQPPSVLTPATNAAQPEDVSVSATPDVSAANALFYEKKKAKKAARMTVEGLWGEVVAKASGTYDGDKLHQMWEAYDTDGSGDIDAAELAKLIGAIVADVGATADAGKLASATIVCMDEDGNGKLTWAEFVQLKVVQQLGNSHSMIQLAQKV